jgi:outer membrane protein
MKLVHGCAFAVAMTVAATSWSEDLVDIMTLAKQSDPMFRGAGFDRAATAEGIKQARARLLPSLSYSIENTESDQTINETSDTVFGSTGAQNFTSETNSLTLSQSIFNYEYWMRYGQSKAANTRADSEFEKASQDLLLRVAEAYFESIKAREQLASIGAEKAALKRHLQYAQKSHSAGIGRSAEVNDAEARYLSSVAKQSEFNKAYNDARYALFEIIGRLPEPLAAMRDQIPLVLPEPADPEAWITQGLANNPDVKIAQKKQEEARYEIKAQTAGHYPTLSLTMQNFTQVKEGSLYGGLNDIEQEDLTLKFDLPLYQGGAVSSRRREAYQRMYKAQEDIVLAQRTVQNQAQSSFQGIVANIAQIKALKQTVVAQNAVLDNKERGFQTGLYSIIAVLDAQQDLASAQQNYIAARNDYAINYIRLKRAAGVLIDTDIEFINGWLQ